MCETVINTIGNEKEIVSTNSLWHCSKNPTLRTTWAIPVPQKDRVSYCGTYSHLSFQHCCVPWPCWNFPSASVFQWYCQFISHFYCPSSSPGEPCLLVVVLATNTRKSTITKILPPELTGHWCKAEKYYVMPEILWWGLLLVASQICRERNNLMGMTELCMEMINSFPANCPYRLEFAWCVIQPCHPLLVCGANQSTQYR